MEKISIVTEFVFWGLSQNIEIEEMCFVVFYFFYTVILQGNLLIILTVCVGNLFTVHSRGDQSWVFTGRTDTKAETPIL